MITRLVLFFSFIACQVGFCQSKWSVKEGRLDLRDWNSVQQSVISLDGDWEFYWKELLLSKDLPGRTKSFARLSLPWNEQQIDGRQLTKNGYATYALTVQLPPNTDSISFAVPAVFNSYAFWINDTLICESGKVGRSAKEMEPRWKPQTVSIATHNVDTLNVIFQISNFQNTRGGCAEVMRIGNTAYLKDIDLAFRGSALALILFFGVSSLAVFIIFFIIRSKSFLFLSLLAMAYTIRFLFSDLYLYYDMGIDVSWEVAAKMEYLTIPLIVLCGAFFMHSIYPKEFKRSVTYFLISLNAVFILVIVFSPSSLFSPFLVVLQVTGLTFVVYTIFAIIKALVFQKAGAWVSTLGITVFAAVGSYNIYAFLSVSDLNRVVIDCGYALALLLNVISLLYRTPLRLHSEEQDILRFSDFYNDQGAIKM